MIPRHALPQIPKEKYREFVDFLKEKGVWVSARWMVTDHLTPVQSHVNREKVEKFKKDPSLTNQPIIISEDHFILDGHHRWIARKENKETKTLCIMVECDIKMLIELGHEFDGSFTKTVFEVANYEDEESSKMGDVFKSLMVRYPLKPKY